MVRFVDLETFDLVFFPKGPCDSYKSNTATFFFQRTVDCWKVFNYVLRVKVFKICKKYADVGVLCSILKSPPPIIPLDSTYVFINIGFLGIVNT